MNADDSLRKAADRLAKIQDEVAVLQSEAREIQSALAVMRRFGAALPDKGTVAEPQKETVVPDLFLKTEQLGMSQAEFEVQATKLILEEARPLTRSELMIRFAAIGKRLPGNDPLKTTATKLWRARERLVNIRGAGYWPKERPLPALGYTPDTMTPEQDYDPDFPKNIDTALDDALAAKADRS
jgi:hypothetical protein